MPHFAVVPGPPSPNPRVLSRSRLLQALDAAAATPLTILRGPAGAGKTTLLQDWAAAGDLPAAWVSARRSGSPQANRPAPAAPFLAAVFGGLFGGSTPGHLALVDQAAQAAAAGAGLGAALHTLARLPARKLLVVEDLHLATGFPAEDLLLELLRAMPGLRIVASTAALGGIEKSRALLELDITVIGPDLLAFTAQECAAVLAGTGLEDQAEEIRGLTGGLPRWVRFLALTAAPPSRFRSRQLLPAVLETADRDLTELLSPPRITAAAGDFLLAASVPGSLPPALAERLCGGRSVEAAAAEAEQEGFLTRTHDGESAVIPLLRSAVLARGRRMFPERVRELEETCGRYFLENGQPLEALGHAIRADTLDLATDVIRRSALELFTYHGPETRKLLEEIPLLKLARQPAPALALAVIYNSSAFRRMRGTELTLLALSGARALYRSMPQAERLLLTLVEAVALRGCGQLPRSAARAAAGLQAYAEMPLAERGRIGPLESVAVAHLGISLWRTGAHGDAEAAFTRAASIAAAQDQADYEGYYHSLTACLSAETGDLSGAAHFLQLCAGLAWGRDEVHPYAETPLRLAEAMVALESGDHTAAKAALARVLDQAGSMEFWPRVRYLDAIADLAAGKTATALARLEDLLSRPKELPPVSEPERALLIRAQSLLLLASGLPGQALTAAGRLPKRSGELVTARIHLAGGQPGKTLSAVLGLRSEGTVRQQAEATGLSVAARLQLEPGITPGLMLELARLSNLYTAHGLRLSTSLLPAADLERVRQAAAQGGLDVGLESGQESVIGSTQGLAELTPRELAILGSLVQTGSLAEIAQLHFVSVNTVKSQIRGLYRKLGVSGREDALKEALRRGVL
ncbi:LuxR C-terminal-related transcriptional regulator [Arthrobacter sp. NPDC055585]